MKIAGQPYPNLVLVCTNQRNNGRPCCAEKGSLELFDKIKTAVAAANPLCRVSRTGCLGNCATGITVVIMPKNKWFGGVTEKDIPEIVRMIETGARVQDSDDDFLSS